MYHSFYPGERAHSYRTAPSGPIKIEPNGCFPSDAALLATSTVKRSLAMITERGGRFGRIGYWFGELMLLALAIGSSAKIVKAEIARLDLAAGRRK